MSTGDKLYLVCYEENVVYRGLSDLKKKFPQHCLKEKDLGLRFTAGTRSFSLLQSAQTGFEAQAASY